MSFKDKFKSFFDLDERATYEETPKREEHEVEQKEEPTKKFKNQNQDNVVSLTSIQNDTKMVLCEPTDFDEAQDIADHIMKKKSVVVNLQRLDHNTSVRIVDFLSGTVYALSGNIQKLGQQTFLCTPDHVDISGSISELFNDSSFDYK
ncbi:cell division protein SepF [Alkalibacillus haloalkaliphilus]|uniref:cell division protein SepF n=1 Tax=Alkalibacillus haloalkaliphilus TaxID=94136 RepID=UPI0002D81123|nr:cell division protein SepF [Alkalibacillus haloalkaliphilus]